jgi:uncharacterized protein YdeI (YjbR/CyaY-like superfamily)
MAPVVPNPKKIRAFPNEAAFEKWLSAHHESETELWIKFYKKGSGLKTVVYKEALDVALCWGWIDGIVKTFDEQSYLQRFTPRKAKSVWSQINRTHVARLIEAGRMTPHGLAHVDAAKADGRWENAYAPIRSASADTMPEDLMVAIRANKKALKTFGTLNRMNLFAMAYRVSSLKTAAGRARKIAAIVATLSEGKPIV